MTPSAARRGRTDCDEVLPDLVEAQAAGLALGVAAAGAQRREVVVAIDARGAIEVGDAGGVGGADQRVQRKRGRAVAARELVDEARGRDAGSDRSHGVTASWVAGGLAPGHDAASAAGLGGVVGVVPVAGF